MYSVHTIADYLRSKVDVEIGESLSNLQLQKLVYYAQGWYLARYGKALFRERIEAWKQGPVVPELYRRLSDHGASGLPPVDGGSQAVSELGGPERAVLDAVWEAYGQARAWDLVTRTHAEAPWREARGDTPAGARSSAEITQDAMRTYFESIAEDLDNVRIVREARTRKNEFISYDGVAASLDLPDF